MNKRLVLSSILGGLSLTMAVGLLGSSAWLIAMASTQPPILILEVAIVSVRFFGLSRGVFRYGERVLSHDAILRNQYQLQTDIYHKLEGVVPLKQQTSSSFFAGIIHDSEIIQDRWLRIYIPWFSAAIAGTCGISAIFYLSPHAGTLIGSLFIFSLLGIPALTQRLSLHASNLSYVDETDVVSQISNISRGFLEARIYGYAELLKEKLHQTDISLANKEKVLDLGSGIGIALNILATSGAVIIGLTTAIHEVARGELGAVNIVTLTLLPLMIFDGISSLPSAFTLLGRIKSAEANIKNMIQQKPIASGTKIPNSFEISLTSVRASWGGESLIHQPITSLIEPGVPLVVSGESGIGKSSLALAIIGLIPHEGTVRIGGEKNSDLACSEFVTLSLQGDHIFNSSIKENIRIGNPMITEDELKSILAIVELDNLISSLPRGIDTVIGTYGTQLSGGEKQRIRLARALVRTSPIYILDEPFEFLEQEQVDRISEKVFQRLSGTTLIVISHDLLTIPNASRIYLRG